MKARILIVEDEGIVALDIEDMLTRSGYEVISIISSGEEAIPEAIESKPDLILMDIRLQGNMLGTEAGKQINRVIDSPIVFLTAHSDSQTIQDAKQSNPYGYIVKPFEQRDLITTIELALYKHLSHQQEIYFTNMLKSLVDNIPIGIIMLDQNHRISMVNPKGSDYIDSFGEKSTNAKLEQIMGYSLTTLISDTVRGSWQEIVVEQPDQVTLELITFSTPWFHEELTSNNPGWMMIIRDVSTQRSLQKKLENQEHISSLKQFAENMAYDLVKSFKPIDYNLTLLESVETQITDRGRSLINDSKSKLKQVDLILDNFKKVNQDIYLSRTKLGTLYELIESQLNYGTEITVDKSLYFTQIESDNDQLIFASKIIIDFLKDFSESDSKIKIASEVTTIKHRNTEEHHIEYIVLKFEKLGEHLPIEVLPHIFEPYLVDRVFNIKLGLLLSQANLIVKQHKGFIQVKNLPEYGVSFSIFLPIL